MARSLRRNQLLAMPMIMIMTACQLRCQKLCRFMPQVSDTTGTWRAIIFLLSCNQEAGMDKVC